MSVKFYISENRAGFGSEVPKGAREVSQAAYAAKRDQLQARIGQSHKAILATAKESA